MKVNILKKSTVLTVSSYLAADAKVKPPQGFRLCATVESPKLADALKRIGVKADCAIRRSPCSVFCNLTNVMARFGVPFEAKFLG